MTVEKLRHETELDYQMRLYTADKKKIEYTYTYGYDVTKETYPERIERAKKEKSITRMVMQLLATVRLPMI